MAGIAILDHPSNFRHPQPTRLNPDNPFFNYAPSVAGEWRIEPGAPYVSRYRFVTYEGEADRALLELAYGAGLRVSEWITLGVRDVLLADGLLRVFGKGSKLRPQLFHVYECENILLHGVTFTGSPFSRMRTMRL